MFEMNPWDETIWDPIDPEQAIEDPMHGPSAIHNMLQTPAMPLGDGTYYQPGAFYTRGTAYVDSQDRPVFRIGGTISGSMREARNLQKWVEASNGGEEALILLEARRQQARLATTGLAHCFKPTDVCPGGKKLEDCDTGNAAFEAGQKWADENQVDAPGDGAVSHVLAWAGGKCTDCSIACEVAVKTVEGQPQETRVSFYRPLDIETINLDLL